MSNYEYEYTSHINPGILSFKLNKEHIDLIWTYIKRSAFKGWTFDENNKVLTSGHHQQWTLYDNTRIFQQEVLIPAVNAYADKWGYPINIKTTHWPVPEFNRFWVRFSNISDYHALHDHQAVWSFVIWLNLPTTWENEQEGKMGEKHPHASDFQICYTDSIGRIRKQTYKLDRSGEGTMLLYPSDFHHQVYPHFTSDEFRVAVAGDVSISSINHLTPLPVHLDADLESDNFVDSIINHDV
jgi:Putative 2OG-Fe(II) oxygenase